METSFTGNFMLFVNDCEGRKITIEHDDITSMMFKAIKSSGISDRLMALNLADKVMHRLNMWNNSGNSLSVNDVEQMMRFVLNESGQQEAANQVTFSVKQVSVLS
jgi:hypothetical protein